MSSETMMRRDFSRLWVAATPEFRARILHELQAAYDLLDPATSLKDWQEQTQQWPDWSTIQVFPAPLAPDVAPALASSMQPPTHAHNTPATLNIEADNALSSRPTVLNQETDAQQMRIVYPPEDIKAHALSPDASAQVISQLAYDVLRQPEFVAQLEQEIERLLMPVRVQLKQWVLAKLQEPTVLSKK